MKMLVLKGWYFIDEMLDLKGWCFIDEMLPESWVNVHG
jgi:hypothetical protein